MFWEIFLKECKNTGIKPTPATKKIGVSHGTVTAWKQGTLPNIETMIKIAEYFDCSIDYLIGRTAERKFKSELSDQEEIIIKSFRKTDARGKAKITQVAMNEEERAERERSTADSCCTG